MSMIRVDYRTGKLVGTGDTNAPCPNRSTKGSVSKNKKRTRNAELDRLRFPELVVKVDPVTGDPIIHNPLHNEAAVSELEFELESNSSIVKPPYVRDLFSSENSAVGTLRSSTPVSLSASNVSVTNSNRSIATTADIRSDDFWSSDDFWDDEETEQQKQKRKDEIPDEDFTPTRPTMTSLNVLDDSESYYGKKEDEDESYYGTDDEIEFIPSTVPKKEYPSVMDLQYNCFEQNYDQMETVDYYNGYKKRCSNV